ncbi:uncharacterized protein LOC658244 [Tribolium castaneum]|uniref:DUF4774 domain-containing protein n=1 Tax=Tribolium castaneum TaxID=7070 RepID=A0A139WIX1_TRICA|nr:PREDICTED: uncharacterized protein LOC658244 [Tribolium castaneum]KYB27727.1 hypothetical protein TcasGA2_TC032997 [Tribolium castaneum]|eukprot:XP_008194679.1 PREDICTED: uncharacterized protein LOC658244 [Tribolium castaneum]
MFLHIVLVIAAVCSSQGMPQRETPQITSRIGESKQLLYLPERQQYTPELQYDLSLLDPQFQVPSYNFIGDKQHFPRVQPQIVLINGGATPGQFLLQPGSPPGNFLVPQGPNVILRDPQGPQRPVFVAGYPKPAHIPPIEKDAEEVPTNPAKIPPLTPKGEKKPEKLETFDEPDNSKKQATEAEVLAAADRNPAFNTRPNLRPGQRFFILNGQPLFSNFPYNNQIYPGINPNLKYAQVAPSFVPQTPTKNISPFQNVLFRNTPVENTHKPTGSDFHQSYPENLVLLNQPGIFQDDVIFRSPALPLNLVQKPKDEPQLRENENGYGLFHLRSKEEQEDDTIVVDAKEQQDGSVDDNNDEQDTEAEVVSAADKPDSEPTISQAQPGAIALAGPGGVAAAAPRGTAFVGKEGVAVSSPQATAVAGPSKDAIQEKNKKQNKRKQ